MSRYVFAIAVVLVAAINANAAVGSTEAARLTAAAGVVQEIRTTISPDVWSRARCVAVIPDLKKAAFIIGGEYGKGVMSCRSGDRWSPPVFMQLAKGSWGFQAGAEQVDVVLLVMNEQGVQKLLQNKVNLGADASIAAGPLGRQAGAGTDAALKAEIVSYSRAQGLFAGIDLSGGVLRPDEDANVAVYGKGSSARTILASREISAPPQAAAFLKALDSQSATTATPTASNSAASVPATTPATTHAAMPRTMILPNTDDSLRTKIVDIQQNLDRILADTTPAPVGTSGTVGAAGDGTITVDRVRLLELRQQLDALIAALNRR
jgi:SH3 domain-containing YSC84-like protein 1